MSPAKKKDEKVNEKDEKVDERDEELAPVPIMLDLGPIKEDPKLRVTGVYGDINEERCSEALYSMCLLRETAVEKTIAVDEKSGKESETYVVHPIEFIVSTHGGSATEMFALYDAMRSIREDCPIHTFGVGKVMSAGVLLLAAGTRGERRIGANCRVMIHGVVSGQHGYLADIENEFEEAKFTQELYVKALAAETDMTVKYIKNLVKRKTNVYLSAKDAVELGIADIIV